MTEQNTAEFEQDQNERSEDRIIKLLHPLLALLEEEDLTTVKYVIITSSRHTTTANSKNT